jgi:hypothetical protein
VRVNLRLAGNISVSVPYCSGADRELMAFIVEEQSQKALTKAKNAQKAAEKERKADQMAVSTKKAGALDVLAASRRTQTADDALSTFGPPGVKGTVIWNGFVGRSADVTIGAVAKRNVQRPLSKARSSPDIPAEYAAAPPRYNLSSGTLVAARFSSYLTGRHSAERIWLLEGQYKGVRQSTGHAR